MYDLLNRRPLKVRERPLIVMECSVIADRYLGLGYTDQALDLMLTFKRRALRYGGNFTLLWHNSGYPLKAGQFDPGSAGVPAGLRAGASQQPARCRRSQVTPSAGQHAKCPGLSGYP